MSMDMSALYSELGALAVSSAGKISLSVRVCRTWQELEDLRPTWNPLLQSCLQSSIFQTPEWLASWWHSFGANKELLTLIFRDGDENIIALAPMYAE